MSKETKKALVIWVPLIAVIITLSGALIVFGGKLDTISENKKKAEKALDIGHSVQREISEVNGKVSAILDIAEKKWK